MHDFRRSARLAVEGHENQAPGIEAREERRNDEKRRSVAAGSTVRSEDGFDDRILGEETGGADDRARNTEAGNGDRADDHHPVSDRDQLAQAAHAAHVLLFRNGMDDRTGAKEQKRLEESVREQVEHGGAIGTDTQRCEHVAELRAGRIGDHALDVVLHEGDRCREEGSRRADDGHDQKCGLRQFKDRRHAGDHEHASRHHGSGVNERRNRRRAFHGVRKPGVQQELRRLAHRAHEEQQAGDGDRALLVELIAEEVQDDLVGIGSAFRRQIIGGSSEDRVVVDRLEQREHAEDAEQEAEVTNAVDDEGLHGGSIGRRLLEPETDQEIRGQTHAFPAEEHLDQIVRRDQHEHGEGEERQIGEEARTMRIVVHISNGIDMHESRYRVHHNEHDAGERIDAQSPVEGKRARGYPVQDRDADGFRVVAERNLEEHDPRQDRDDDHETGSDVFARLGSDLIAEETGNQEAEKRKEDDRVVEHLPVNLS